MEDKASGFGCGNGCGMAGMWSGGELKSTSSKAVKSATLNKVSDLLPW